MNQESYLAKKYLLNQVTQRVKEGIERTDVRGAGTTRPGPAPGIWGRLLSMLATDGVVHTKLRRNILLRTQE